MKVLIAILSCSDTQSRLDACIDTWVKDIKPPHDYVVYGCNEQAKTLPKCWNCTPNKGEHRLRLPEKTYKMLVRSLEEEWDLLYKCDDDTFVNVEKLLHICSTLDISDDIYMGRRGRSIDTNDFFIAGGEGYIMSRTTVEKIIPHYEKALSVGGRITHNAEDLTTTYAAKQANISLTSCTGWHTTEPKNTKTRAKQILDGAISVHPILSSEHRQIQTHINISRKTNKVKIFCYYDETHHSQQQELIDLWALSWSAKGYEPIVYSRTEASRHPKYNEYVDKLSRLHEYITGKPLKPYGLCCYLRWLAYSRHPKNELFFVSDYDVINIDFSSKVDYNQLHLMDGFCPSFASGRPEFFDKFSSNILKYTEEYKDYIKYKHPNMFHYHDQEFVNIILGLHENRDKHRKEMNVKISNQKPEICSFYDLDNNNNKQIIHFAHSSVKGYKEKTNNMYDHLGIEQCRLHMIRSCLNNTQT